MAPEVGVIISTFIDEGPKTYRDSRELGPPT